MPRGKSTFTMRILADTSQMVKSLNATERQLNSFAKVAKISAGVAAGAFIARPLINFAQQSIQAASDLEESISKVNVVFGNSASIVQKWSDDSVTSLGLSQGAAQEAAGTFGNLLVSFGEGQGKAALMSTTLVQLAADLASFNNTSVEDAILALRSGLSGETEPLKRFGIVLQDTRLRAEAMAMGLEVSSAALDPLVKSQAAYSLILKDSATAQGDFVRTADGLANTTRVMEGAFAKAKETIGVGFVEALTNAATVMGGGEAGAQNVDYVATRLGKNIEGLGALVGRLTDLLTPAVAEQEDYNEALRETGEALAEAGGGFTGFIKRAVALTQASEKGLSVLEALGAEADYAKEGIEGAERAVQAMFNVMSGNTSVPDHLVEDLRNVTGAAREAADAMLEFVNSSGGRAVRQMDSFGRALDKNSIYWQNAADDNKRYWDSVAGRSAGSSGASAVDEADKQLGKLKNLTTKQFDGISERLDQFVEDWQSDWDTYQDYLQRSADYVKQWQTQLTQNLDIGRAFTNANDRNAAKQDAYETLQNLLADPDADPRAVSKARNNYYKAAAAAAVSWQQGFANQLKDAETFYTALGDLKNTGLNQALIRQVASLGPGVGTELAHELINGDSAFISTLNDDWAKVTNKATELGVSMSDTFVTIGGESADKWVDEFLTQINNDARKVKREIKKKFDTTVTVKYVADTSGLPFISGSTSVAQGGFTRSSTSRGRQIVEDIQAFELVSGRSWRV